MWKEFREFIARGNVIDLAIAVIVGAAFGGIVTSLVQDIINPIIGYLFGDRNFTERFINLSGKPVASYKEAKDAGLAVIGYGSFLTVLVNFLLIMLVLFFIVKGVNRMQAKKKAIEQAKAPELTKDQQLLTEIRDAVAARR